MAAWGFVGMWYRSRILESRASDIVQSSLLTAQYIIGDTRMRADMIALRHPENDWFWTQFGTKIRPHQICGALVPASAPRSAGWTYAGLQLVLTAAARQARPGASHASVLRALEQAFLAETLVAEGIAVTRLRAELLRPGIALTGSEVVIDRVTAAFADTRAVDPMLVERSRLLSGNW
jgi:hypothetical protein